MDVKTDIFLTIKVEVDANQLLKTAMTKLRRPHDLHTMGYN